MSRYIDADNLKEQIPKDVHADAFENCRNCKLLDDEQIKELIDLQPTADVRENVRGEWFPDMIYDGENEWCFVECSNCKYRANEHYNFCPNCGADMRGDKP